VSKILSAACTAYLAERAAYTRAVARWHALGVAVGAEVWLAPGEAPVPSPEVRAEMEAVKMEAAKTAEAANMARGERSLRGLVGYARELHQEGLALPVNGERPWAPKERLLGAPPGLRVALRLAEVLPWEGSRQDAVLVSACLVQRAEAALMHAETTPADVLEAEGVALDAYTALYALWSK